MVRASKPQRRSQANTSSEVDRPLSRWKSVAPWLLLLAVVGLVLVNVIGSSKPQTAISPVAVPLMPVSIKPVELKQALADPAEPIARYDLSPQTLEELLKLPANQLGRVDIGRMNLLCAVGLPGSEKLDVNEALAVLDRWAQRVSLETRHHLYRVNDPRYADLYHQNEALFRASMLVQVLQEDLGVQYDMTAIGNFHFNDSRVAFIHGMIPNHGQSSADVPGGTCASMPVLYVAVGRRLGYPLKLATTNSHLFVRWEGLEHSNPAYRHRFNIEGSGPGFASYDDDYYTKWPVQLTDYQVKVNRYLLSLTPMEEFSEFLAARGHCAIDNKEVSFAARCYENAYRYDPTRPANREWLADAAARSGYRPSTPALQQWLAQKQRGRMAQQRSMPDGQPLPEDQVLLAILPVMPTPPQTTALLPARVGVWGTPQVPSSRRITMPLPPLDSPSDHSLFRSQP